MKRIIILISLLITIATMFMIINKQLKKQKIFKIEYKKRTNDKPDIKNFLEKTNILIIENKNNSKIPFLTNDKNLMIKTKYYNNNKNLLITTRGKTKIKNNKIKETTLKSIKTTEKIISLYKNIKKEIKINNCKKVKIKDLFIYIDKGVILTFRKNKLFTQINLLNNQIFVWLENTKQEEEEYYICDYNSDIIYDKLSNYIYEINNVIKDKNE